jgi:integrase
MRRMSLDWVPKRLPKNWPYTPHRDGWVRWYKGRAVFVAGKTTPLGEVEDRWIEKKTKIDSEDAAPAPTPESISVIALASLFLERQERRLKTGRPKPISPFTYRDYIRTLEHFIKCVGKDTLVAALGPAHFEAFAAAFDKQAASSLARAIAYIQAMFKWGTDAGHCERPRYGPDFIKPDKSAMREERLGKSKLYTPAEIAALWRAADIQEKLWMALAINCAFDNSDLSNLTWEVIDLGNGVIDYRRRKRGKVRRVAPLLPRTWRMLKAWRAVHGGEFVFKTDAGYRLVRTDTRNNIDFVAARWTRLMQRAGLRPKPTRIELPDGRRQLQWTKSDGRRGFRGLRTTFSNLVPPGFGDERRIVMGHSHGDSFLDNYLETVGVDRIRTMCAAVWAAAFKDVEKLGVRVMTPREPSATAST